MSTMIKIGGNGNWKFIEDLLKDIKIPRFAKVKQVFPVHATVDVETEIIRKIEEKKLLTSLQKGARIAIAVGSRGIANLPLAVKVLGRELRTAGAEPFIVPAMGSHGGATAEGQAAMLRNMGFDEKEMEMPIVSGMDTIELGKTKNGLPVLCDKNAVEADGIIITNRIKPHVSFRGPYECGLMKMLVIGLGKQRGADYAHNLGFGKMPENIPEIGLEIIKKTKLLFAVGFVENAFHDTHEVVLLRPDEIESEEPKLLNKARELCPKLYFETLDTLIIDEIGKHISGTGFDTNVVGRYHSPWISGGPSINRILILDISDTSKGNSVGLGIADFTTRRAAEKFDFSQTYPNSLTSTATGGAKIPMILPNDRLAIQSCIKTSNLEDWAQARMVRIRNTLCLTEIEVSESMLPSLEGDPNFEVLSKLYELPFNAEGNLF